MNQSTTLPPLRKWILFHAAADFLFLQNRSYPRSAALELVGNRYAMPLFERQLLLRGVFSRQKALARLVKKAKGSAWRESLLVVDGHNVQITIESHIQGRVLLKANDGAMRDLAGLSSRFRVTEASVFALDMIFRFLREFRPREVLFLFDAPMSHSGELAAMYRERLKGAGFHGDARAVPVPEREFPYADCVVASSDHAVLDAGSTWIDLAARIIEQSVLPEIAADFSQILFARSAAKHVFEDGGPFW